MLTSPLPSAPATMAGWEALVGAPVPTRRQEHWRFTDLAWMAALEPRLWSGADPWGSPVLPPGVTHLSCAEADALQQQLLSQTSCQEHWPVRLNTAARTATLALRVEGAAGPLTLDVDAGYSRELLAVALVLLLEPGSSLDLSVRVSAAGPGACSLLLGAALGSEASLQLGLVASGHGDSALLAHLPVLQAPGSSLALTSVSAGWGFSRLEPRLVQQQGAASSRLRALQWAGDDQLADTHALVRFEGPDGTLDQLHKAVADGTGRSVFNGAVQVPRLAQRTDAAQLSRSLLLSDRARIDTKPELEIVADDVRCAHGATISQLQSEELFYLQSRGIARAQAAQLLLQGYCAEVVRELPAAARAWLPPSGVLLGGLQP